MEELRDLIESWRSWATEIKHRAVELGRDPDWSAIAVGDILAHVAEIYVDCADQLERRLHAVLGER